MQKDRKKQQDLQRLKTMKTRINKGKTRISAGFSLANDSNFDRNPLRGCNYGLEGVHF